MVLLKLTLPIFIGAVFMKLSGGLSGKGIPQKNDSFEAWVDAFYFATVTATSVGFGDLLPQVGIAIKENQQREKERKTKQKLRLERM